MTNRARATARYTTRRSAAMSKRPRVTLRCVADTYADKQRERIIEFFDPQLQAGGLISFYRADNGTLAVHIYGCDQAVKVQPRAPEHQREASHD